MIRHVARQPLFSGRREREKGNVWRRARNFLGVIRTNWRQLLGHYGCRKIMIAAENGACWI